MSDKRCLFRLYKMCERGDGELVLNGIELSVVDEMLQSVPEMSNGDGCVNVNVLNAIKNWL